MTKTELTARIEEIRSHFPPVDGPHLVQRHDFLDIDPDLADRDYDAIPAATEAAP